MSLVRGQTVELDLQFILSGDRGVFLSVQRHAALPSRRVVRDIDTANAAILPVNTDCAALGSTVVDEFVNQLGFRRI